MIAPYDKTDPANITAPAAKLSDIGAELWQHDIWWQIISAALSGNRDQTDLSHHPALAGPAISRYAATTPKLLRWFKRYNEDRLYRDQVKPFGFLISLTADPLADVDILSRQKRKPFKPIAPFTRDPTIAAATAFDRETDNRVPSDSLKTYAQALAQYHLHPEGKFLNGDFLDRGSTQRRHVHAVCFRHIGKEANDWEARLFAGLGDTQPDYGGSDADIENLRIDIRALIGNVGMVNVAKALGVTLPQVRRFLTAKRTISDAQIWAIASSLTDAISQFDLLNESRSREIHRLREHVQLNGLRATARANGTDPSNLRRKIKSHKVIMI